MHRRLLISTAVLALGVLSAPMLPAASAMTANASPAGSLATDAQRKFEVQALRILASEPMKNEIARVEALYASDPQGKTPTGRATIHRAAESIAMAAIQYAVGEDADRPAAFWVVNAPHDWWGLKVPRSGYGIDNPDNVYRNIMIDGAARYEIRGRIKQPGPVEQHFELRDSIPGTAAMAAEGGKQLGTLRSDEMKIAADGSFTITLDSEPAGDRPNHIQTPASGKFLLIVRDLFTDWEKQNPIALEVHRVSGPAMSPPPSEAQLIDRSVDLLRQMAPYWVNYDNTYIFTKPVNQLGKARVRPGGRGFSASGHFNLAKDEALVVTLDPLGAVSLGIQLSDPWGVAYEYASRTSSLNTAQAKPNPDGTYSFVISTRDPGVYNWLDPEGYDAGMFAIRWQTLPSGTSPEHAVRQTSVVKLKDLKSALPKGTVFITEKQRKLQQAERLQSHNRRLTD